MTTNLRPPRDYAPAAAAEEHRRKAQAAWTDLDPLTVAEGLADELAEAAIAGLPLDDADVFQRVDRAERERRMSRTASPIASGAICSAPS